MIEQLFSLLTIVSITQAAPPCYQRGFSSFETPCYKLLDQRSGYEIRRYGVGGSKWQDVFSSVIVANPNWNYANEVAVDTNSKYVNGLNSKSIPIVPVTALRSTRVLDYVNWRIMQYLPASTYPSIESLPSPTGPQAQNVKLIAIPDNATFAVLSFKTLGKSANDGDFRKYTNELNTSLTRDGFSTVVGDSWSQVWTAFFNETTNMEQNEVWLQIDTSSYSVIGSTSTSDTITITLEDKFTTSELPGNFASFSYEVKCAPEMFSYQGAPRKSFVNLMNALRSASGGAEGPNIRIGGNSADESVYIPDTTPLPTGDTYRISDADFSSYLAAVPLWNGSITPGVNFRDPHSAALAVAHLQGLGRIIPLDSGLIDGVEIGNECDLYAGNGIRTPSWNYDGYRSNFSLYQGAVQPLVGTKIQGLTWCCHKFDSSLDSFLNDFNKDVKTISYHEYPLNVCDKPPQKNTIYQLLDNGATDNNANKLAPYVTAAASFGLPFFIGEGNSVACGGETNVSDIASTALWSVDSLFKHAEIGITRWNYHGCPQGAYTAIAYESDDTPDVRPLFYGMWIFTSAIANNARLVSSQIDSSNPLIRAWCVKDASGKYRVAVIHKDINASTSAHAKISALSTTSSHVRRYISSEGPFAKKGLTFGGLTFDGSTDGNPSGTPTSETIDAVNGFYEFDIQPGSIALIEM
jgi:hypothetical protein